MDLERDQRKLPQGGGDGDAFCRNRPALGLRTSSGFTAINLSIAFILRSTSSTLGICSVSLFPPPVLMVRSPAPTDPRWSGRLGKYLFGAAVRERW